MGLGFRVWGLGIPLLRAALGTVTALSRRSCSHTVSCTQKTLNPIPLKLSQTHEDGSTYVGQWLQATAWFSNWDHFSGRWENVLILELVKCPTDSLATLNPKT